MNEANGGQGEDRVEERNGFCAKPPIGEADHQVYIDEYGDDALEGRLRAFGKRENDDRNGECEEQGAVVLVCFGKDFHDPSVGEDSRCASAVSALSATNSNVLGMRQAETAIRQEGTNELRRD